MPVCAAPMVKRLYEGYLLGMRLVCSTTTKLGLRAEITTPL